MSKNLFQEKHEDNIMKKYSLVIRGALAKKLVNAFTAKWFDHTKETKKNPCHGMAVNPPSYHSQSLPTLVIFVAELFSNMFIAAKIF